MKFTVLQENLKEGLTKVNRAIASHPQLPVLANVLIEAKEGKVCLTGTDLELGIKTEIGAKVEVEGKVTVPAKMFGEFVSSIPAGKVEIDLEKETLKVRSGRYKASFQTIGAAEYPQFPEVDRNDEAVVVFEKQELEKALQRVGYAAAKDSMRPILTGVLFELGEKNWRLVATDGFRLALTGGKFEGRGGNKSAHLVIPLRGVNELSRLDGEKIELLALPKTNQIVFWGEGVTIISQLLDGSYPNYKKIIPEDSKTKIKISRGDLLEGVGVSQVFAKDNSNVLKWLVSEQGIKILAESPEMGKNEVEIEAEVEGDGGEVAFNGRFLLDFLQNSKAEMIEIGLGGSLAPGSFKEVGNDEFLYIVMPINL